MKSAVGKISVFTLAMINVAAVLSLRNLPGQAEFGYSVVFYIVAASLLFFIPSTLVSAELASAWQQKGGVYVWVKEAFRPQMGVRCHIHAVGKQPAVVSRCVYLRGFGHSLCV